MARQLRLPSAGGGKDGHFVPRYPSSRENGGKNKKREGLRYYPVLLDSKKRRKRKDSGGPPGRAEEVSPFQEGKEFTRLPSEIRKPTSPVRKKEGLDEKKRPEHNTMNGALLYDLPTFPIYRRKRNVLLPRRRGGVSTKSFPLSPRGKEKGGRGEGRSTTITPLIEKEGKKLDGSAQGGTGHCLKSVRRKKGGKGGEKKEGKKSPRKILRLFR